MKLFNLNFKDELPIYVLGDVHREWEKLNFLLEKYYAIDNSYIIQVGDFGIGLKDKYKDKASKDLNTLNNTLNKNNIKLFVIRGNHDNPNFFGGNFNLSNIFFIKDYSVLELGTKKIFLCGGAISPDRINRKKNINYWEDEIFKLNKKLAEEIKDINYVITHICPNFCYPYKKLNLINENNKKDKTLMKDIARENSDIKTLYEILSKNNNIKYWFYGHFHQSYLIDYNNTLFKLLNIMEFSEINK